MSKTRVINISGYPAPLPLPYSGTIPAGGGIIVSDTVANVITNLGSSVGPVFAVDAVAESNPASNASPPSAAITSDLLATGAVSDTTKIADGAVATADIAAGAVVAVDIGAAAVTSVKIGVVESDGLAPQLVIRKAFTALTTGTADDVIIYDANAPFAFRIIDFQIMLATTVSASTAQYRSAKSAGGSALSDAFDTHTATGRLRDTGAAVTATPTIALNGTLVLRRSDRAIAGEAIVVIQKT